MQAFLPCTPLLSPPHAHAKAATTARRPPQGTLNNIDQTASRQARDPEASALTAAAATFLLRRAAETYQRGGPRPRAFTVLEALLQLERTQKRHRYAPNMGALEGQWRLIFTGDPRKKLTTAYFPIRAHQTFKGGVFDNGVFLLGGAVSLRFAGPMRFGGRNRMEFSVDRVRVKVGGFEWARGGLDPDGASLDGRRVKHLPFFSFFLLRDDLAAARGRSGGLALYARLPEDQHL